MKIIYKKTFAKAFQKVKKNEQQKIKKSIELFTSDIFHPQLNNHSLKGKYLGFRSINAGGDIRLIFEEKDGYIEVIFIDLGTHSELY